MNWEVVLVVVYQLDYLRRQVYIKEAPPDELPDTTYLEVTDVVLHLKLETNCEQ
jgi:hypothetical protein